LLCRHYIADKKGKEGESITKTFSRESGRESERDIFVFKVQNKMRMD
jgi:hypothetical protein